MAAIIFDFDGTISDSFEYVAGYLIRASGFEGDMKEKLSELRGLSMVAIARRQGHSWLSLPRLFIQGRREMRKSIPKLEPFPGMPEVIRKIHAEGHELFMLSSNSVIVLHKFLHRHKLHTYFLELYGGVSLFGKAPAMRKLMKDQGFEPKDCIYVGDELRDVEASKSVGIKVIAVSWGFAKTTDLENLKPTALVHTPAELLSVIEEI